MPDMYFTSHKYNISAANLHGICTDFRIYVLVGIGEVLMHDLFWYCLPTGIPLVKANKSTF